RVLRQGGVEAAIGRERQRGRVGHVRMQDAGLRAEAVDRRMDEHRRGLHGVTPRELVAIAVDHHDVGGADLAPEQAARVQKKPSRAVRQLDAEVIADPFREAVMRGSPQRQGQIAAKAAHPLRLEIPACGVREGASHQSFARASLARVSSIASFLSTGSFAETATLNEALPFLTRSPTWSPVTK